MTIGGALRKALLTLHIISSVGMLGAVAAFLVLAMVGLIANEAGAYYAMDLVTGYAIVPLAWATLVIGVLQSLATPWGLFRHYWIVVKLVLIVLSLAVLLLQVGPISLLAELPPEILFRDEWTSTRLSTVLHAGGGLALLTLATVLSVFKPRGLTRYGWNRLNS
jgi:hypothetical protein